MADPIRGDGLYRARAALFEDPERLDRARARFSQSPPSYRSHLSRNSTLSQSPNAPNEETKRREEREYLLKGQHSASMAWAQLKAQESEEIDRILEADDIRIRRFPVGRDFCELAHEIVKERWLEQGIWNEQWEKKNVWWWKHEEPLEPESESETDPEAEVEPIFFPRPTPKPRRRKNDEELQRIAERRPVREREREASRPFHQFVYQVSKEREWIQDVINAPKSFYIKSSHLNTQTVLRALAKSGWPTNESDARTDIPDPPDVNAMAYETVKKAWIKRGIWNKKWGILPGSSWKHEHPLEEMLREEMDDDAPPIQADELGGDRCGLEEASPRSISESLPPAEPNHEVSGLLDTSQPRLIAAIVSNAVESGDYGFGGGPIQNPFRFLSPAVSIHRPESSRINSSPQAPPSAVDPPRLPNDDVNHSSAASHLRSHRKESQEDLRSRPGRKRRRGNRELSREVGQSPQKESNGLGPIHSLKVSKARRKSGSNPQRRPKASKSRPDAGQALADLDVPASPPGSSPLRPRRSRRLQEAERKMAPSLADIAAANPRDGGSRSRLRRTRAGPKPA
ncbi:MAG: hypothetical protein LQ338_001191 [Usnochroma carphineum]|nr:MAG: hypothetical protein LQ338_001191 [Usnochroma carphineum]